MSARVQGVNIPIAYPADRHSAQPELRDGKNSRRSKVNGVICNRQSGTSDFRIQNDNSVLRNNKAWNGKADETFAETKRSVLIKRFYTLVALIGDVNHCKVGD